MTLSFFPDIGARVPEIDSSVGKGGSSAPKPRPKSSAKIKTSEGARGAENQKAADVWKKDVWELQVCSQTFIELRFSLGNEGKDGKNLDSQTWPGSPRHPRPPERRRSAGKRSSERVLSESLFSSLPRPLSSESSVFGYSSSSYYFSSFFFLSLPFPSVSPFSVSFHTILFGSFWIALAYFVSFVLLLLLSLKVPFKTFPVSNSSCLHVLLVLPFFLFSWFASCSLFWKHVFDQVMSCNKAVFLRTLVFNNIKSWRFLVYLFCLFSSLFLWNSIFNVVSEKFQTAKFDKRAILMD